MAEVVTYDGLRIVVNEESFSIGWEENPLHLRACRLCGVQMWPRAGYQLYVESDFDQHWWCCRECALPYAPRLTALLLEGWRATEQERVRA